MGMDITIYNQEGDELLYERGRHLFLRIVSPLLYESNRIEDAWYSFNLYPNDIKDGIKDTIRQTKRYNFYESVGVIYSLTKVLCKMRGKYVIIELDF